MKVDDMNEARELGFLGGKLDNPVTIKFNDLTDESIEAVANASDMTKADWIREACIEKLLVERRKLNRMRKVWGNSKETIGAIGCHGVTDQI
ncbi:hypothetical protein [Acinetobacter sp. ESBL14]|uniref:hypothetical protein n=1 Tax=Acinetobacter sp. ESBL14 TaxID=3077329 RepID=UPI002FCA129B